MEFMSHDKIKLPTLKELGIDADGLFGDILQTPGEGPMTCGFFRMNSPGSFDFDYTYEEYKVVLEGEFTISDNKGNEFVGKPGDLFHFQDGDKITFDTNSSGLAFYVSQREKE